MNQQLYLHLCNTVTNQAKSWHSKRININVNTHTKNILYTTYSGFINIIQSKQYSLLTGSMLIRT